MMASNVDVRIEELVLEGFASADGGRIGEAVERELARLLAEQGLPLHWLAGLSDAEGTAGSIAATPDSPAAAIGIQVAQAVYGDWRRE